MKPGVGNNAFISDISNTPDDVTGITSGVFGSCGRRQTQICTLGTVEFVLMLDSRGHNIKKLPFTEIYNDFLRRSTIYDKKDYLVSGELFDGVISGGNVMRLR
jgi:hypothetical protein